VSLSPGTRRGPYEVTAQIGAGGMGEVCRARDSKLNRDVALKVLPSAFGSDPDRMTRFHREAQLLAALFWSEPVKNERLVEPLHIVTNWTSLVGR